MDTATGFCTECKKQVLIQKKSTSHIFHLLMSIITGGLWIIIWILSCLSAGTYRCAVCGTRTTRERTKETERTGIASIIYVIVLSSLLYGIFIVL